MNADSNLPKPTYTPQNISTQRLYLQWIYAADR